MKRPEVAGCVASALEHFSGERYDLWAWCVMPNHVHAVVQPLNTYTLSDIYHSWLSYTASEINRMVGRRGRLWQAEPFDHVVRSVEKLRKFARYTLQNPAKAGLSNWRWAWISPQLV